jgi:Fe-Mn family superoxide dismutase
MEIHHDRHHAAYMNNLNNAIANTDLDGKDIVWILSNMDKVPANIKAAVQNNGGGYANHNLFWSVMGPNAGGEPTGALAAAINNALGSFANFKTKFSNAGATRFGSGWAWLVVKSDGSLDVYSTANQDSPYMNGDTPILGLDVWEHAYYLHYQNRRPDYIAAWWNVVNWNAVAQNYAAVKK